MSMLVLAQQVKEEHATGKGIACGDWVVMISDGGRGLRYDFSEANHISFLFF